MLKNTRFVHRLPNAEALMTAGVFYLLLIALAVPFLLPFLWMVSTALKPAGMVYASPPQWLPQPATLANFQTAWGLMDFPRFVRNSFWVAALTVLGTLLSSSLVGFAFATLPGRGKQFLFNLMLATVMIPATVTLIPLFVLFSRLGWVNTYLPLVLPAFFANAFYVFLFRQFFRSLPPELFECAELDGCNPFMSYWRIALPLSRPALATVAVFAFVSTWNDFMGPLVYLSTNEKYTLSLGLAFFQGTHYTQLHLLMPMSLVALLPVLVLFLVAQRYFVQGIVTTGFK
jgi:ABC-type glycerol-3-phosphate transport system permease component